MNDNEYRKPFTEPSADIIFCSADKVYFRLHKIILSLASDFFKSMLSLPQPVIDASNSSCASDVDGIPVVHVTEPGDVLESLFRLCYPIPDPPLDTIDRVRTTLEAALKYEMQEAVSIATYKLQKLVKTAPSRVYAIAHCLSLMDVVPVAANAVSQQKTQNTYVKELEEIPVSAYRNLLIYCNGGNIQWTPDSTPTPHSNRISRKAARKEALLRTKSKPPLSTPSSPRSDEVIVLPTFDPDSAEVIIRTSDGVRLGVSKEILRLSSPVLFEQVIAIPSDPDSDFTTLVVDVAEPGAVMLLLLSLCHPNTCPDLTADFPVTIAALEPAQKYHMKKAVWHLCNNVQLLAREPSMDPVSLYFAACRFRMPELAKVAAQRTLRSDLIKGSFPDVDLPGVSAGCLWRLLDYHRRCRTTVRALFDEGTAWISPEWTTKLRAPCTRSPRPVTCCWLEGYLRAIGREAWPDRTSPTSETALAVAIDRDDYYSADRRCGGCRGAKGLSSMLSFSKYLEEIIDEREGKVELPWLAS
ncbi:hypothetical protein C8Q70DRAFT_1049742 [Cubamyces menziesii]|nr:hypothetical protein C8Q70DRAFT_1049742 [Cubamyces menziesii]